MQKLFVDPLEWVVGAGGGDLHPYETIFGLIKEAQPPAVIEP